MEYSTFQKANIQFVIFIANSHNKPDCFPFKLSWLGKSAFIIITKYIISILLLVYYYSCTINNCWPSFD